LAPHYEEAATALKEKGIKLAKVDCVDEAELCQQKGVQGYPYVFDFTFFLAQSHLTLCHSVLSRSTARVRPWTTLDQERPTASSAI